MGTAGQPRLPPNRRLKMKLFDRIVPTEALRWGVLTNSWSTRWFSWTSTDFKIAPWPIHTPAHHDAWPNPDQHWIGWSNTNDVRIQWTMTPRVDSYWPLTPPPRHRFRLVQSLHENWNGLRDDYRLWRNGTFTFKEFATGRVDYSPPPLSLAAQRLVKSPDRPIFKADPERLFPFQQRWERPDPNPFPDLSLLPWRKHR